MRNGIRPMFNSKIMQGERLQTPDYRLNEHILGFETEMIFFEGLPAKDIRYIPVPNTRKTIPYTSQLIKNRWEEIKDKNPNAFDAPRARYEGSYYDQDTKVLHVLWSEDRYSTHAAIRETILPKAYQANLFTINGIPITADEKIPIAVRNPKTTDQGRIKHITPAGFIDLRKLGGELKPESVEEAVTRKLLDELQLPSNYSMETPYGTTEKELHQELTFPETAFNPDRMRILGIVYNYRKNFDYEAAVLIPLDATSSEITLRGKEHDELEWINTSLDSLKSTLYELAIAPETNSGHLRGDIALSIGHRYGQGAYLKALDDIVLEFSKLK